MCPVELLLLSNDHPCLDTDTYAVQRVVSALATPVATTCVTTPEPAAPPIRHWLDDILIVA